MGRQRVFQARRPGSNPGIGTIQKGREMVYKDPIVEALVGRTIIAHALTEDQLTLIMADGAKVVLDAYGD